MGFPSGISGAKLVELLQEHIRIQNIPLIHAEVLEIQQSQSGFVVQTKEESYECTNALIATGTAPKSAQIEGEDTLRGKKLFYEICDLPPVQTKTIGIIGGGDAGFDYALALHALGHEPTIITRGTARCLPLLQERVKEKGITLLENCTVARLQEDTQGVSIVCEEKTLQFDYVLIAVGRKSQYPSAPAINTPGLYFVGDVQSSDLRQMHIATGDALRSAMAITNSIIHHS
jgi:thioredoxin reductase